MGESKQYNVMVGDDLITVETGKLAGLAGGAVTVRMGDTMLLATATMSREPRSGIDYFPMSVDYEEKLYAAGRIPGSFFRREGRASEGAILTARLTDRPLRPLFPKDMRNDVQIIITSLSVDQVHQPDILAIIGASAALTISDIPFGVAPYDGPIGAVRVGRVDGKLVVNPTFEMMEKSEIDLRIAGTRDAILMVECGAREVSEAVMVEALEFGHQALQPIIELQAQMAAEVGKAKRGYQHFKPAAELETKVKAKEAGRIAQAVAAPTDKTTRNDAIEGIEADVLAALADQPAADVKEILHDILQAVVRARIIKDGMRPDGRGLRDIRPLAAEVGISPRAHGSGLFTRGETQVLSLATLGTPRDAQELDTLSPDDEKRYMHHYNFPPFSTGEVRMLRGSSRREVGHGALAERALIPVLPSKDDFAYTLRVVSEALSSNGSTSMASVCGSTLALMDAGVPISAPVAGIAMGLVKDDHGYAVLTDIQGLEDHLGDMDFKVAGTAKGITALQMDIKIKGLTAQIMSEALAQAREARLKVLEVMLAALPVSRPDLSPYAPRLTVMQINPSKIGAVIGPGGKMIRKIQEETGVKIDIEDDGKVFIASTDGPSANKAREMIAGLTESPEIGRIYTGKVVRTTDFGAFVEIMPGMDGMVHISQLADYRVEKVEDVARLGDELTVMVINIDEAGKIRLSRQAVLAGWTPEEAMERDRKPSGGGRPSGDRGGRPGGSGRPGGGRPGGSGGSGGYRNR
ncbi:MAG: polyribonucleotide nucleotidyltransferase [Chloroflexi bacterium]|nr:polyribonucleotide nucleotidyltransferase [Chloroflexota bacterium]MBI5292627.1 polyribonucleotide nucleotidyltransferase [Chloroflexota bacterium]